MTTTKSTIIAALASVLLLAGCASGPTEGTIQDKRYRAEYWYTTMQCSAYNGKGYCQTQIPVQQYAPPSWAFDLYRSVDNHGWHSVSEETYEKYEVGDYYTASR